MTVRSSAVRMLLVLALVFCPLVMSALYYEQVPALVPLAIAVSVIGLLLLARTLGALPELTPRHPRGMPRHELYSSYADEFEQAEKGVKAVLREPWILRSERIVESCIQKGERRGTVFELVAYYSSFFEEGSLSGILKSEADILRELFRMLFQTADNAQPTSLPQTEVKRLMEALRKRYILLHVPREPSPYHFFVIDNRRVVLEEYHARKEAKAVYVEEEPLYLAQKYNKYFNELVVEDGCRTIDFSRVNETTCETIEREFTSRGENGY